MINIYSQSGQVTYGIIYYTVDTENEKNSLPTKDKMGSKCYVIESETWYILNGNGEWVPFVGEDSTADAILISIKNMSAEQKDQLKKELDIENGGELSDEVIEKIQNDLSETERNLSQETLNRISADNTIQAEINTKQDTLVSGTNIKTINNQSLLGSGNITIQGGGEISPTVSGSILEFPQGSSVRIEDEEVIF